MGVCVLMCVGCRVLAASSARVVSTHLFATKPDYPCKSDLCPNLQHSSTFKLTYGYADRVANIMIWAVIENHLAVVVACAPSIKGIALLIFPRLVSSFPKILSRITRSRSRSRSGYSNPRDVELGKASNADVADSAMKSPKSKLEALLDESPLPSPMTPVFLPKSGKRAELGPMGWGPKGKSEDEEEWVYVGKDWDERTRKGPRYP